MMMEGGKRKGQTGSLTPQVLSRHTASSPQRQVQVLRLQSTEYCC